MLTVRPAAGISGVFDTENFSFQTVFCSRSKHILALLRSTGLFSHVCWGVDGEGLPGGICLGTSLHSAHSPSAPSILPESFCVDFTLNL